MPLANGCTLLVDPVLSFTLLFVLHSGGPGQGSATVVEFSYHEAKQR